MNFTPDAMNALVEDMEDAAKKGDEITAYIVLAMHPDGKGDIEESGTSALCGTGGDLAALLCNFYCSQPQMFWMPLAYMLRAYMVDEGPGYEEFRKAIKKVFTDDEAKAFMDAVTSYIRRSDITGGIVGNA
jgi:hypothetical protein